MRIDPSFPIFLDFCRRRGAEVKVVSDGFDRVVSAAFRNAHLSMPFFANKPEWKGGDRWHVAFPHAQSYCRVSGANCKCSHAQCSLSRPLVVVGDGRSDFCMSTRADYAVAKGTLADYCRLRGQAHASFTNFSDVTARLSAWLAKTEPASSAVAPLLLSPTPTAP